MKVKLMGYYPNCEEIVARAMRGCRHKKMSSELELEKPNEYYIKKAIDMGHLSVLEHASFTFSVGGVSRVLTHQLVRHRIASYSQQSHRAIDPTEEEWYDWYIMPESISKVDAFRFQFGMSKIKEYYDAFIKMGIPKEDARYFLPNASKTNITVTMNARELRHFFTLRLNPPAQWEIRTMAKLMLDEVMKIAPCMFEDLIKKDGD